MLSLGFAIEADGRLLTRDADFREIAAPVREARAAGVTRTRTIYRNTGEGIEIGQISDSYDGVELVATSLQVTNRSARDITLTRVDTVNGLLPSDRYTLKYYRSDWGQEFSPTDVPLAGTKVLEVTTGRSSKGMHPWCYLSGASGRAISAAVAWSGNWIIRMEPAGNGVHRISAGLSNWEFAKVLRPGESMESPQVLLVDLAKGDLSDVSLQYARWGRKFAYPKNELSRKMPVEWNHWWPYEDAAINENVFKANSDAGKALGVEATMLDAGWFGPADGKSMWYNVRGDWDLLNTARFPSGLPALSSHVRANGQAFGIWCEIEAIGQDAQLAKVHPEFLATHNGRRMGYVCFGNPAVRRWATQVIERMVKEYGARWIKFDFNLDPGEGCNRTDHGHGKGDGLFEHYHGYYTFLDGLRERFPDVLLENCSSGGLRIDLGMMQHLHTTFLSDPDYTEHALQLTWGASTMLHPSAMLRFTWSQTRDGATHNRLTNPIAPGTPQHKFDYILRTGMIGMLGLSYRLNELTPEQQKRLRENIDFYKTHVRDLMRDGDFYALNGQPLRDGTGERWPAFMSVSEDRRSALVFVLRLPGGAESGQIRMKGLDTDRTYLVRFVDRKEESRVSGAQLMADGLRFEGMPPESSEAVLLSAQ